ncbi:MAG: hypothetical protein GY820_36250 [Gammaproteobacteria bacterium]|nr:hypothetical protein [Gammaproteobacteria bacterium]
MRSLVAIARFHQIPAEVDQLQHEFGSPDQNFTETEILLAAKALSLRASHLTLSIADLKNAMLPAIARAREMDPTNRTIT